MASKACKLLHDVDAYFNNGIVDENKFNSSDSFTYKCPYENRKPRGCKNNNERINALGGDLYDKLARIANNFKGEGDNGNRHIEIFIMWLSDKLYKLDKNKSATLEESYEKHLKDYTGNFKYWNIIDSKRVYKKASIWYMSELYSLLKYICDLINEYNKKPNKEKIEGISKKCHQKFTSIYKDIKDCYSYFHLLKFLKNIYDDIRNDAIKKDTNTKNTIRRAAVRKGAIITDKIKKLKITPPIKSSSQLLGYILNTSTISLIDLAPSDWNQRFSDESDRIVDFHTQACVNLFSKFVQQVKKNTPKDIPEGPPQLGSNQSEKEGNQNHSNKQPETLPQPPAPAPQIQPQPSSQNDISSQKSQKGTPGDGNGNPGNGSSDPPSSTSEGSFNFESFFEFLSNSTKIYDKASNLIEQNKQRFKEAKDNLKIAYDQSSRYFSDTINNITTKLNQVALPTKPDDKQPGAGSPVNGGNTPNQPPSNPQIPSPPNQTSTPPIDPKHQKQVSPQSQPITQQNTQIDPPKHKTADKTNFQLVKLPNTDPNLKKKWNILPTTWNGSAECKPEVNFMNATLACCTSEQCSLTGISVTLVLIPIFLLIAYKFLSREWTKKSEKKNMKRVINLADGNRKTQIIIKSYDRNKDLKPVINSVSKKKYPLLNIYKLMQADPVPFINLFFLLIFFVYKENMIL
ncbi:CIR protein [Plasmodium chabaudi chabaudi]|uniref:CIR protein n=1 Tax=Plasmodium chabaudi chabaudi TaxID=31271 RepID=A0A1C6WPG4_PLACU|nr:CIR protein [Plasmodium chabaudi chabaudi]